MATLARCLRERLAVSSVFMLWGLMTLCESGCGVPPPFSFPPGVAFINGQFAGTVNLVPDSQEGPPGGLLLPTTGTLEYLPGNPNRIRLHTEIDTRVIDTNNPPIVNDIWVTSTPTEIKEWSNGSGNPEACQISVWAGSPELPKLGEPFLSLFSYPQCTAWTRIRGGSYSLDCTLRNATIFEGTTNISAELTGDNKLVQLQQSTNITGVTDSFLITMTQQATTPPPLSDFNLPSICNPR